VSCAQLGLSLKELDCRGTAASLRLNMIKGLRPGVTSTQSFLKLSFCNIVARAACGNPVLAQADANVSDWHRNQAKKPWPKALEVRCEPILENRVHKHHEAFCGVELTL
jgi:hypothetical protein